MRRLLLLAALLSALCFGLSACDVSALPYAAKVGGSTITTSNLNSVLDAVQADAALRCYLKAQGISYAGAGSGTFSSTFTAQRLSDLIEIKLYEQYFKAHNISRPAYASDAANTILSANFSNVGSCTTSGATFLASMPAAYRNLLTSTVTNELVLAAHEAGFPATKEGLASYEQQHANAFTTTCFSVIVVASRQKAAQLADQIRHGASFSAIAKADSIDTNTAANGGAYTTQGPCPVPNDFTPPINTVLAALSTGAVSDPVQLQNDYVLFQVTSRQGLADAQTALESIYAATVSSASGAVSKYAHHVGVQVNPAYGGLNPPGNSGSIIVPPKAPADAFLLNSAALSATTGG